MSFLKKLFSRDRSKDKARQASRVDEIVSAPVQSLRELFSRAEELERLASKGRLRDSLTQLVSSLSEETLRQIHNDIREKYCQIDVSSILDSETTRNLVTFRLSLYTPEYQQDKDTHLGKLFMILFNLSPELLKRPVSLDDTDAELTSNVDIDSIMADLSIFNLSDKQLKYTVAKILEYNEKNVVYTDEEIIFLNNSELLRNFLEQITRILQDFVQSALNWRRYLTPDSLKLNPLTLRILNIDSQAMFPEQKGPHSFFQTVIDSQSTRQIESRVPEKMRPLFRSDFKLVISAIRNAIIKEHVDLISQLRQTLCWNFVLLDELGDMPPYQMMKSLLEKSLRFHRNYYPDLVKAINPSIKHIFGILGRDNQGIPRIKELYPNDVCNGMTLYVKSAFSDVLSYDAFIQKIAIQKAERQKDKNGNDTGEGSPQYLPQELNFLKRNPDAELGILVLNEKMAIAEEREPILEGHYFYNKREDYLKVALLEALQTLLTSNARLKIIRSLLQKSLDRSRPVSTAIMEKLISKLKEDGLKSRVIQKLLDKQLRNHHLSAIISEELKSHKNIGKLVNTDEYEITLDKFSKVTNLAFFKVRTSDGTFRVTAKYVKGKWEITHVTR